MGKDFRKKKHYLDEDVSFPKGKKKHKGHGKKFSNIASYEETERKLFLETFEKGRLS